MSEITEKYLWVEKYRPKQLKDLVMDEEEKEIFSSFIKEKEIPNLLFVGSPGTGKTTIARILVNGILNGKEDLMFLNGSSERGIDVVRNSIEEFLKTPPMGGSKIKIILIDEFDHMTLDAQTALRYIIEQNSDNGRFIFTANYESKIIPAIQSRMMVFKFHKIDIEYLNNYVFNILKSENVKYKEETVRDIVKTYYPDVRKIVGILQSKSKNDNLLNIELDECSDNEIKSNFIEMLKYAKESNVKNTMAALLKISKILSNEQDLDFVQIYKDLFNNELISIPTKMKIVEYADTHLTCLDPTIHFYAMCLKCSNMGKN